MLINSILFGNIINCLLYVQTSYYLIPICAFISVLVQLWYLEIAIKFIRRRQNFLNFKAICLMVLTIFLKATWRTVQSNLTILTTEISVFVTKNAVLSLRRAVKLKYQFFYLMIVLCQKICSFIKQKSILLAFMEFV